MAQRGLGGVTRGEFSMTTASMGLAPPTRAVIVVEMGLATPLLHQQHALTLSRNGKIKTATLVQHTRPIPGATLAAESGLAGALSGATLPTMQWET